MEFQLTELGNDSFAYVHEQDGKNLAEITWVRKGDVMVMDHTFVDPSLRGQGVAKKLLDQAADYARDNGLKMQALCSYVVSAFNQSSSYDDVKA
ncbi:GNAT family N-acetyltransferase [Chungangia koreensis]|uniref:GNAT family N-acetyltransferase n=1 Tax=Chungangia koreensis TaxID=752657 RepID=A0ABV8X649_9LACT